MAGWGVARRLFAIDVVTMALACALAAGTIARPARIAEWQTVLVVCGLVGTLLVVATVYLRDHYVVDVLAGAVLAAFCLAFAPAVHAWLARQPGTLDAGIRER